MPTTDGRPAGDHELSEQCVRILADELGDGVPLNDIIDTVAEVQLELTDAAPQDLPALVVRRARTRLRARVPHSRSPEAVTDDLASDASEGADEPPPPIPFPRRP